jgi:hypothetical protein
MDRFNLRIGLLTMVILECLAMARPAGAEDFRVDNAVYAGSEKEPSSQSTTIFHEGAVYDCLKVPAETIVFEKLAGRFTLLDLAKQKRSEVTTVAITAFLTQLRPKAVESKDPLMKFLADPNFRERADESTGELILSSPLVTYRVKLAHEATPTMVTQYRAFCDWYARLNSLLVPGSRPPFARLKVDAALAERKATPSQVVLTVTTGKPSKPQQTSIRSEHQLVSSLEPTDLERVKQCREFMKSFTPVDFKQYRKLQSR